MKRIFIIAILSCVNIFAWGQTEKGKELLEKAKAGEASAQSELAECYEFGEEGFGKDDKQALTWYTKAAEQNDLYALGKLELAYKSGKLGVAKNDEKYIYYLKKAAKCGKTESMIDLAVYYRDGKYGLKKDENEFLRLAKKAANGTSSKAKYELGVYYKSKNNKDEAIKWYKDCADYYYKLYGKNHEDAISDLKELGVNYDPSKITDENEPKDGQVVLYDRLGRENMTCKIYKEGNQYKVKVDNRLYPLKVYNKKINGVLYTYYCQLFDAENYVKEDPDLPTPGAARSTSAKSSKSSSASKTSSATKSTSATKSKSSTESKKSSSSNINDKINDKVKSLKKKILK